MYLGTLVVTAKLGEKEMADKKEDLAGPGIGNYDELVIYCEQNID